MRLKVFLFFAVLGLVSGKVSSQNASTLPCANNPKYKQFDFWVGDWDVYNKNNRKVADSKIENVLDGCVVMENYQGLGGYKGRSFSTYNDSTKQWQQTYVDNFALISEMRKGHAEDGKMTFIREFMNADGSLSGQVTRMILTKVNNDTVTQFVEQSKDGGKTWMPQINLEYRRKAPTTN